MRHKENTRTFTEFGLSCLPHHSRSTVESKFTEFTGQIIFGKYKGLSGTSALDVNRSIKVYQTKSLPTGANFSPEEEKKIEFQNRVSPVLGAFYANLTQARRCPR